MQMTLSDYHKITLGEYLNKVKGFYKHLEFLQEAEWTRMNYMVYNLLMMNPYIKATDKPKSFEAFVNKKGK